MFKDQFSGVPSEVLGLRARLSQAWIAPGLLCLIIFVVKLQLLKQFLAITFKLTNEVVVAECKNLTLLAERVLQAPEEAVKVANQLITASVNSAIRGIMSTLRIMVKIFECLILFILEVAIGSYACLTISAVNIAANEALNATEAVIKVANSTAESIGKDINKGLNKLSSFIDGAVGLIGTVEDYITGGKADLKSINLTVSRLDHLNISLDINTKLERLRKDIPTYNGTQAAVKKVIAEPFRLLESQINSTNITFHPRTLPTQSAIQLEGCNISKIDAELAKLEKYVFMVIDVLCGVFALIAVVIVIIELWKVKNRYRRLETVACTPNPFREKQDFKTMAMEKMQLITTAETPFLERLVLKRASQRSRWLVRYVLSPPLLSLLCLGLAGIIISLFELIVLSLLKVGARDIGKLASSSAKDLTKQVQNALATWRNDTNGNIAQTEFQVNNQILGWVHQGSQSVNNSISVFMTSINNDIIKVFNNTLFLQPLQAVVQCLIGSKVTAIEHGLTWVHGHSKINLPRIPQELLSQNTSQEVNTKARDEAKQVLNGAIDMIHQQIVVQCIVSSTLISIWVLFALSAYVYASGCMGGVFNRSSPSPEPPIKPDSLASQRHIGLPPAIKIMPCRIQSSIKSPIEQIFDRVGQVFSGPAHRAHISGLPLQASMYFANSPTTPLDKTLFN